MLSARFGDILSELYLLSAALKRWEDEGRQEADFAALRMVHGNRLQDHREPACRNLRQSAEPLRRRAPEFLLQPLGARELGPADRVVHECAQIILEPSAARDRLTSDLSHVDDDRGVARLEKAFELVAAAEDIRKRLHAARIHDWKEGVKKGVITEAEGEKLAAARKPSEGGRGRRLRARGAVADLQQGRRRASILPGTGRAEGGELMARPVFIIDGSRTPFLKARTGPGPFTPVDLAVQCGRPLLARQPFAPDAFDQVILGCVNVIADEMNPARVAALRLGMGEKMVAFTEQINCGSGMQSIDTGLSLHPRRRCRPDPRRRRRSAEPCAAGVAAARRALVRRPCRRQGHSAQDHGGA